MADPNPLAREECVRIASKRNQRVLCQEPLGRLPKLKKISPLFDTPAPINTKKIYTPLEQIVQNRINFRIYPYQKINSQYLNEMRDFIDPNTYGQKEYDDLTKNSQSTCISLIAASLSSQYVFNKLLATLPAEVGILIYLCAWENQSFFSKDDLKRIATLKKNGDKVKVASLKEMSTLCGLNEFYEDGQHPSLKYLKAVSLADFFISGAQWKDEILDNLPLFFKNKIKQYLEFTDYKTLRCREFLKHVKRQKSEYDSEKIEKEIRQSFKTLLTLLPRGEWVAVEHIVQAICYRELATNIPP